MRKNLLHGHSIFLKGTKGQWNVLPLCGNCYFSPIQITVSKLCCCFRQNSLNPPYFCCSLIANFFGFFLFFFLNIFSPSPWPNDMQTLSNKAMNREPWCGWNGSAGDPTTPNYSALKKGGSRPGPAAVWEGSGTGLLEDSRLLDTTCSLALKTASSRSSRLVAIYLLFCYPNNSEEHYIR